MSAGASDYLAAERTFLAWIRTGLALMGFGFVVARFGLFLRALQPGAANVPQDSYGLSFWLGTILILIGVSVNIWSVKHYRSLIADLNQGGTEYKQASSLAVSIAIVLALVGAAMAAYLITVGNSKPTPQEKTMAPRNENGIVSIPGNHDVDETVARLHSILEHKGVKLFALVDHSGEAEKAGLKMPNTKLLIFGNPKAGTPLMLASPTAAIDLPLKILIAEDSAGRTTISWNSADWISARHNLPADLVGNIAVVETLAKAAAQ